MIRLQSIKLNNIVTYEEATVNVESNSGLVVIRGHNLDSDISSDTSNGSGKSLLWSAIPNVLYEASPLSVKKRAKKDMLTDKGSCISLSFVADNGKVYDVDQFGTKYIIHEDGKDLKIGRQDIAKEWIERHWPISEKEFYSYCYVQSQRPNEFQKSTPADRLKFVTEVFGLDIYDKIKARLNKMLGEIKEAETRDQTLASELDVASRQLAKLKWTRALIKELEALGAVIDKSNKQMESLYEERSNLESILSNAEDISAAEKLEAKLYAELPIGRTKSLSMFSAKLRKALKQIDAYEDYMEDKEKYDSKSSKAKAELTKLRKLVPKGATSDSLKQEYHELKARLKELDKTIDDAEALAADIEKYTSMVDSAKAELKNMGYKNPSQIDSDRDVSEDLALARSTIKMANRLERDLDGEESCPTCGQDIDTKELRRSVSRANKQIDVLEKLDKAQRLVGEFKAAKHKIRSLGKPVNISKLEDEHDQINDRMDEIDDQLSALKDIESCLRILDNLEEPEVVEKTKCPYDPDTIEGYLDTIEELKSVQTKLKALKGKSDSVDLKDVEARHADLKETIRAKREDLEGYIERQNTLSLTKREYEVLQTQVERLEKELEKLAPTIERKKVVQAVHKMYGSTNLKVKAASEILSILENSLNTYSSLVFSEPMRFELRPTKQGIGAEVIRGKSGRRSDIAQMSGGETNCFRLLFAVAMLPLVPAERRTNFIILDEPDSACDSAVRERMVNDFLPKLRSLVPNIFWITPKDTEIFQDAEHWTVVKEKGISRLES